MPGGMSWPRYLGFVIGATVSMFAGSQCVHLWYRPLEDFESRVEAEKENLRKARAKVDNNHYSKT
ncbi:hypothetical protein BsWGS_13948 [Bradybaena similaris]